MTHEEIKAKLAPYIVEVIEIGRRALPTLEDEERLDAIALDVGAMYSEEWGRVHGGRWGSSLSDTLATMKVQFSFSCEENRLFDWARPRNYAKRPK